MIKVSYHLRGSVLGCPAWWHAPSVVIFAMLSAVAGAAASPVNVPPSATPGGVQPRLEEELSVRPAPAPNFPIPSVLHQPAPATSGSTIQVTGFVLRNLREWPEHGITEAALAQLLEQLRAAQPQGFRIDQLQAVANAVTKFYREAGFILAQVYIPVQNVEHGIVQLEVQEGRLGEVSFIGNQLYQAEQLLTPFQPMLGQAVRSADIEQALLMLNDYPGLSVYGVFQPGAALGDTDLSIQVKREDKYKLGFSVDNYGSKFTGEYRGRIDFAWHNPFAAADLLSLNLLHSVHPSNAIFGALHYQRRLNNPHYQVGFSWSRNRFEVGRALAQLGIKGVTEVAQLYIAKDILRSRTFNMAWQLDVSRKEVDSTQLNEQVARDILGVIGGEWRFDHLDPQRNIYQQGFIRYSRGYSGLLGAMDEDNELSSRVGGNDDRRASGDFGKLSVAWIRMHRMRHGQSVLLKMKGQYSNNLLTSIEQLPLGGPLSVRAYPNAQALVDKGALVSLEWILGAPGFAQNASWFGPRWGDVLQLSTFIDYGGGRLNHPLDSEHRSVDLKGIGFGIELQLPGGVTSRLDVAKPIGSLHEQTERDTQYFFNLYLNFD